MVPLLITALETAGRLTDDFQHPNHSVELKYKPKLENKITQLDMEFLTKSVSLLLAQGTLPFALEVVTDSIVRLLLKLAVGNHALPFGDL